MANQFETYGLFEESVKCNLKLQNYKKAIDICISMNKWDLFAQIEERENLFENDAVVNDYAEILLKANKKMELVDFYIKTHRHYLSYKTLLQIAEDFWKMRYDPLFIKKIYVFAALEMDIYNPKRHISTESSSIKESEKDLTNNNLDTNSYLQISNAMQIQYNPITGLMNGCSVHLSLTHKILNNIWKGAEAFHFYILCQRQLYNKEYKSALKTSLRLVLYEKELETENVYKLIALSALFCSAFKICSRAISILEGIKKGKMMKLALEIFSKNEPVNKEEDFYGCPNEKCEGEISEYDIYCSKCGTSFDGCVISGESIITKHYFKCKLCRHKSLKQEAFKKSIKNCPLCHVSLLKK